MMSNELVIVSGQDSSTYNVRNVWAVSSLLVWRKLPGLLPTGRMYGALVQLNAALYVWWVVG